MSSPTLIQRRARAKTTELAGSPSSAIADDDILPMLSTSPSIVNGTTSGAAEADAGALIDSGGGNSEKSFWKRRGKPNDAVQRVHGAQFAPRTASPSKSFARRLRSSSGTSGSGGGFASLLPASINNYLYKNSDESKPSKAASTPAKSGAASSSSSSSSSTTSSSFRDVFRKSAPPSSSATLLDERAASPASSSSVGVGQLPALSNSSGGSLVKTAEQIASERSALFERLLAEHNVELHLLRKDGWKGVPAGARARVWRLLTGYVPSNADRREATLTRKRKEYHDQAKLIDVADDERSADDLKMWKQISIDMPRTHPKLKLFQDKLVQSIHRRLLFLWASRHPASGYVQGINDLATPFFVVFLAAELDVSVEELLTRTSIADVDEQVLRRVEADTYWCFSRLLDGIHDHYTFAQPGIQRMVHKLQDVIARVDRPLSLHLAAEGCQFIQFSFRWFNCLLMRELSLRHVVRMWDTYLSDDNAECGGFASFHAYVCAAFLCHWSRQLRQLDFQEIMLFLQDLPCETWTEKEIQVLLSQAYVWYSSFERFSGKQ